MRQLIWLALIAGISGCATAPRGPAATLAGAGMKATSAFSTDVRSLGQKLAAGDVGKSFTTTWQSCKGKPDDACKPKLEGRDVNDLRRQLSAAIEARARALDALHAAYSSLNDEAGYESGADMESAVEAATQTTATYVKLISKLTGASPVLETATKPLGWIAKVAAGASAERRQRERLARANAQIVEIVRQLRGALASEARVFATVADVVVNERLDAQVALMDAGLVSATDMVAPLIASLNLIGAKDSEAKLAKSHAARTAVQAAYSTSSRAEITAINARYAASIAALDELIGLHAQFAEKAPLDVDGVQRNVYELQALTSGVH